jgi:hypothetical protein
MLKQILGEIMAWLEIYGQVKSDLVEDSLCDEKDPAELTGLAYSIKICLYGEVPQFLPMSGRRVKVYC